MSGEASRGPASINTTPAPRSLSRSARTQPADPAPTMTKSASITAARCRRGRSFPVLLQQLRPVLRQYDLLREDALRVAGIDVRGMLARATGDDELDGIGP